MDEAALDDVAEELYGLLPGEFVGGRDAAVKAARAAGDRDGAKAVAALRKPTTAAWLVNAMVRQRGDEVDRLLDLGEALRSAQAALAGEQLRALTVRRQQVVAAMARQARGLAAELGHPVSEAVADDVAETLRAALADPAAAEAVRTGRLTSALSYAGMGELQLADVVALAPRRAVRAARSGQAEGAADDDGRGGGSSGGDAGDAGPGTKESAQEKARREVERREAAERRRRWEREVAAAREAARRLDDELTAALRRSKEADGELRGAQQRQDEARTLVREAEARLQAAQAELAEAGEAVAPAKRERDEALRAATRARTEAAAARERVAALDADEPDAIT